MTAEDRSIECFSGSECRGFVVVVVVVVVVVFVHFLCPQRSVLCIKFNQKHICFIELFRSSFHLYVL